MKENLSLHSLRQHSRGSDGRTLHSYGSDGRILCVNTAYAMSAEIRPLLPSYKKKRSLHSLIKTSVCDCKNIKERERSSKKKKEREREKGRQGERADRERDREIDSWSFLKSQAGQKAQKQRNQWRRCCLRND